MAAVQNGIQGDIPPIPPSKDQVKVPVTPLAAGVLGGEPPAMPPSLAKRSFAQTMSAGLKKVWEAVKAFAKIIFQMLMGVFVNLPRAIFYDFPIMMGKVRQMLEQINDPVNQARMAKLGQLADQINVETTEKLGTLINKVANYGVSSEAAADVAAVQGIVANTADIVDNVAARLALGDATGYGLLRTMTTSVKTMTREVEAKQKTASRGVTSALKRGFDVLTRAFKRINPSAPAAGTLPRTENASSLGTVDSRSAAGAGDLE